MYTDGEKHSLISVLKERKSGIRIHEHMKRTVRVQRQKRIRARSGISRAGYRSSPPVPGRVRSVGIGITLSHSVAEPDPGSGAFLTSGSGIRDPWWVKNQDPGWTTRIIFPRASKQFFVLKYLISLTWIRDPGWKKIRIRDKHPESAALLSQRHIFLFQQLHELPTF